MECDQWHGLNLGFFRRMRADELSPVEPLVSGSLVWMIPLTSRRVDIVQGGRRGQALNLLRREGYLHLRLLRMLRLGRRRDSVADMEIRMKYENNGVVTLTLPAPAVKDVAVDNFYWIPVRVTPPLIQNDSLKKPLLTQAACRRPRIQAPAYLSSHAWLPRA